MDTNVRQRHERRLEALKDERRHYEAVWRDIADHIDPTRYRQERRTPKGKTDRSKIIDSTAVEAWRILRSGMHSGITSPARPWFRFGTFDPDMREFGPVKSYLALEEQRGREILGASNFYNVAHVMYGDLGLFGQPCALMVGDIENYIRFIPCLHGEFWIANNEAGIVETLYRRVDMTVQQAVERFGKSVSDTTRNLYDRGSYDEWVPVWHAVERRLDRDPSKIDRRNKRWLSNYWEENAPRDRMLEESGFDINPIIAPRWDVTGADHYASNAPGEVALPDIRMLQHHQMKKGKAIDKMVDPPLKGPASLRNQTKSTLPGQITYVDDPNNSFGPLFNVNLRLGELRDDIKDVQERVRRAFHADLFLMISQMEGIQPRNQFEIAERKEEKLLQLGPVLERIYGEMLRPIIRNLHWHMMDRQVLPDPPKELRDTGYKVEFISVLAQAQKAVATGAVERLFAFAGNLSAAKPDVLDKLDADQAIDEYADMVGVVPAIVVPDEKVKEARDARAQKQAQMEQAAMAAQVAPAVKQSADAARVLAETDVNGGGVGSLLSNLGLS